MDSPRLTTMSDIPICLPTRTSSIQSIVDGVLPTKDHEPNSQCKQANSAISHPQSSCWQTVPHASPSAPSESRLQVLLRTLPKLVILKPLESFTLFSELPKELKDLVWKQVASKGRLIPLHEYSRSFDPPPERRLSFLGIPSILLVSRHVRREGLRYYQKVTEKSFHLQIPAPSSLIDASTSSLEIGTAYESEDSEDSDGTLISWRGILRDQNDSKVAVKRTVYLNFERDIFSINNVPLPLTAYTNLNFDLKDVSKIQRLSIITTPICGRPLVNEKILLHIFQVNSLRVVRIYIEHAWLCRHGILDLLVPDSNWIRWERHIKTKIIKNREDLQDAGLTSNFTFYWKYQGDRSRSSRLASWKIQRKLKQLKQGPELNPESI